MSTLVIETAGWPPHPQLRARRWQQRLVVGITDLLDATGRGHRLLPELLTRLDHHPDGRLVDALGELNRVMITPVDTAALLDLARAVPDVHALLREAVEQRVCALSRIRRLVDAHRLGLVPNAARVRAVLTQAAAEIAVAGQALALADATLTARPPSDTDDDR